MNYVSVFQKPTCQVTVSISISNYFVDRFSSFIIYIVIELYIAVTVNLATYFADHRLDYSQGEIDDFTFKVKMFFKRSLSE